MAPRLYPNEITVVEYNMMLLMENHIELTLPEQGVPTGHGTTYFIAIMFTPTNILSSSENLLTVGRKIIVDCE